MPGPPRDSQRSKVYRLDDRLRGPKLTYAELTEAGTRIVKSSWFNKRLGRWDVKGRRIQKMYVQNAHTKCDTEIRTIGPHRALVCTIGSPLSGMIDLYHVIAHALTRDAVNKGEIAWHGPEFAKALLDTVARWDGLEAKRSLQAEMRAAKIKHRVYSPEARKAMSDRGKARFATADLIKLRDELASEAE